MRTCRAACQRTASATYRVREHCSSSLSEYKLRRSCCFRTRAPAVQQRKPLRGPACVTYAKIGPSNGAQLVPAKRAAVSEKEGPSTDFRVIWSRLWKLTIPYWTMSEDATKAKWKLAGVVLLTLGTTGVSVWFNFLGRDFFNALSEKDTERFTQMLIKWLCSLFVGIPVYVLRDYYLSVLSLEWREWMTNEFTKDYFKDRSFYQVQAGNLVDNPDQRITNDVRNFTDTALSFSMTILNAVIDLVSFSEILYTIYPPLFVVLVVYSVGGTAISIKLGQKLVGLNFQQEAQEANFRYGLVRVRENAESIAFYGGEASEQRLLWQRLSAVVKNYAQLLRTSRNLEFFTSSYRFLIQILPAAVVAPLYFQGKIGFGVINQSSSAFNHILSDVSLVVYQFESIANFGAVIDRLGEFQEVLESSTTSRSTNTDVADPQPSSTQAPSLIQLVDQPGPSEQGGVLLDMDGVTLQTPDGASTLVQNLSVKVKDGESLLVMGPSGVGKTSVLRAIAGLWSTGSGTITRFGQTVAAGQEGDIMFVPQRPYMVLGSLREQVLYPTWATSPDPSSAEDGAHAQSAAGRNATSSGGASVDGTNGSEASPSSRSMRAVPSDQEICHVLRQVQLGPLLDRVSRDAGAGLDTSADWASMLSLGEQQRLAFARIIISKPKLVIMDEATSALDTNNEELLYKALKQIGVTFVSVGHRPTLTAYHEQQLRLQPVSKDSSPSGIEWEVSPISEAAVSKN
ncbi:hypothetical protein WJX77_005457 [Trebouxia sp. C0004]